MKERALKPWRRYVLVFACLLALIVCVCRFGPWEEYEDGNLLVYSVLAACLTVAFIVVDRMWHRRRETKKNKKNENLNNND